MNSALIRPLCLVISSPTQFASKKVDPGTCKYVLPDVRACALERSTNVLPCLRSAMATCCALRNLTSDGTNSTLNGTACFNVASSRTVFVSARAAPHSDIAPHSARPLAKRSTKVRAPRRCGALPHATGARDRGINRAAQGESVIETVDNAWAKRPPVLTASVDACGSMCHCAPVFRIHRTR